MENRCFTRMGQIGIAVKDLARATEICKTYGLGPMRTFHANNISVQDCEVFGEKVDEILFGNLMFEMDGVTFELLQPIKNTVWNKFIEEQGEGVCDIMLTPTPRYYEVLKERGIQESMKFKLYNYTFPDGSVFEQVMRMHDTREDLGFSIFSFDQTEETKKRKYPEDNMATGWYEILEDGTEEHLRRPQFTRIKKIIVAVENLEETIENYKAYGFGPISPIESGETVRKASFVQNTDGEGVIFEIVEPVDEHSGYARFLKKFGRGVYNVIFEQNPEFNNLVGRITEERTF